MALEAQSVPDALEAAEPGETLLQCADLTAPETAQDAGLQGVGPQ